jgi:hypothetical protein
MPLTGSAILSFSFNRATGKEHNIRFKEHGILKSIQQLFFRRLHARFCSAHIHTNLFHSKALAAFCIHHPDM